tara:strand:+ start:1254 stop:2384 length:1131 start_codon:yes stop_codon:yes gene_type:complete
MKELRLLQVIPALKSGGVEQGTVDLANYIAKKNIASFVISNGGRMLMELNSKNVKHFLLPVDSKNPFVMIRNIKKIKKIILENKINLVHVRSRAPAWSVYFACKNICNTVSTFHNLYGHNNFLKIFYNKGLSKVNKIVAISNYVKNSISQKYNLDKRKINVIHRGVDLNKFNPKIDDQLKYLKFLSEFKIPNNKKIILFPARLTNWKGQLEFLEILQNLSLDNFFCYFVGDDKNNKYRIKLEKEIYKKRLNLNCKILGHLAHNNMRHMYKTADIIISAPLKPEGFGRIVCEALAMKKIILCYNFGGVKEQILGLDNLYAVEPYNKKEMIDKINKAVNFSSIVKKRMGEIARKHIEDKFTNEIMLKKYLKLYNNIIQ